ncbi:MAG TPA: LysR substrate-binding domain-containing protein, partial [Adhaeribacter sp.]|nr:LysR substrate-binding domain-containing protein [Adhaeribacter sp.]
NKLWLLEEGHCLRNQIFNLCELKKNDSGSDNLHYEAGSIETLINLVDKYEGTTIIPHFAVLNLSPAQQQNVREFAEPKPVREISLVVANSYPRKKLVQELQKAIKQAVPFAQEVSGKNVLKI